MVAPISSAANAPWRPPPAPSGAGPSGARAMLDLESPDSIVARAAGPGPPLHFSKRCPMFAVIRTGGKQYRVARDDVIAVERLAADAGEAVAFADVLMLGGDGEPQFGAPLVEGATVTGEVVEQTRAAKIIVFKKRRRQNYRRTRGHRQHETLVRITDILTGGARPPAARATPRRHAPAEPATAEPAARTGAAPRARARSAAPSAGDDLKKIAGIGPAIEKKLNALGITTFAEIAAFSADDVERVNGALKFKGRIEREQWVEQAARLAGEADC